MALDGEPGAQDQGEVETDDDQPRPDEETPASTANTTRPKPAAVSTSTSQVTTATNPATSPPGSPSTPGSRPSVKSKWKSAAAAAVSSPSLNPDGPSSSPRSLNSPRRASIFSMDLEIFGSSPMTDEQRSSKAQEYYMTALRHDHGRGKKRDQAAAARLYREAADLGHPKAAFNLGNMVRLSYHLTFLPEGLLPIFHALLFPSRLSTPKGAASPVTTPRRCTSSWPPQKMATQTLMII